MKHYLESIEAVFTALDSGPAGLSEAEAAQRLERDGKNKLAEGKNLVKTILVPNKLVNLILK